MRVFRLALPALALALLAVGTSEAWAQARRDPAAGTRVHGKVVRVSPTGNSFVVGVEGGKEVTLYTGDRTRYRHRDKDARFTDIRVGMPITAAYEVTGERYIVSSMDLDAADDTAMTGTIVRTLGDDRFVVRTADGKEVIFYAEPKSVYEFEGRPGRFTDLREGVAVDVNFDVREKKHYARRVIGRPKRR